MNTTLGKPSLRTTKNYAMFENSADNRPVDLGRRKTLLLSMTNHGFLPAYPLHCIRNSGKLEIRDGQHRFAVAQKLGLYVWYVILEDRINVAAINNTQRAWTPGNYAACFAAQGNVHYGEVLEFSRKHGAPIAMSAALLGGTISWGNIKDTFTLGAFTVTNSFVAEKVATIYAAILRINRRVKNARLLEAVYAVCHVEGFDTSRLVEGVNRCGEKLVQYSTRDAYLVMLEDIYNYGRKSKVAVKIPAENAMKERNVATKRHSTTTSLQG